jgi:hypothetical protein
MWRKLKIEHADGLYDSESRNPEAVEWGTPQFFPTNPERTTQI